MNNRKASVISAVVITGLFIWYFLENKDSFKPILDIQVGYLVAVAVLDVFLLLFNGLFLKLIVEPFNKNLSYRESAYVSVLSSIGNFFAPAGGGLGFRAVYLKSKHKLSYANYLSTLSGNYVIVFICTSIFGLLSLFILSGFGNPRFLPLFLVFLGILLGSVLTMFLPPISEAHLAKIKQVKLRKIITILNQVANGWDIIKRDKRLVLKLLLVTILSFSTTCIATNLIANSLAIEISTMGVVLMAALGSLSFIINITPANFGIKETIFAFSASTIGISTPQALSIALIDRGVLFFIMVMMWLITTTIRKKQVSIHE